MNKNLLFFITLFLTSAVCARLLPGTGVANASEREPVAVTHHFAFYNDFATNLHDALLAAAVARRFDRDELFESGNESACFRELAPFEREAWNLAVDYYAKIVSTTAWDSVEQQIIRMDLAGYSPSYLDMDLAFLEIAAGFRAAAAVAYSECRWAVQKMRNDEWIADIAALLYEFEPRIVDRMSELFQESWNSQPVDADIVETVSWSGTNSTFPAQDRAHILISQSANPGVQALETVFHEASHGFMLRGDPLRIELAQAAQRHDIEEPEGLWHVLLFHTTGAAVKEALAESGMDDFQMMIYRIYPRSDWRRYKDSVERHWPKYLSGEIDVARAIDSIVLDVASIVETEESRQR